MKETFSTRPSTILFELQPWPAGFEMNSQREPGTLTARDLSAIVHPITLLWPEYPIKHKRNQTCACFADIFEDAFG